MSLTAPQASTAQRALRLWLEPEDFAICRLPAAAPTPGWALSATVASVTRTHDELSVVCPHAVVPAPSDELLVDAPWRLLAVAGPLDFGLVGVLRDLVEVLAAAEVPVFAVSTYDTDLLLVRGDRVDVAVAALRAAGHEVRASRRRASGVRVGE